MYSAGFSVFRRGFWLMWLVLAVVLLSGCAAVKDSISAVDACRADYNCTQQMEAAGRHAALAAASVPGVSEPLPIAISSIVSWLVGWRQGRKLKK